MPEFTLIEVGLLALTLLFGAVLGWIYRADRSAKEKIAINASWQQQIESQQSEHDRLAEQNKSLMEQISQYQASHKDSTMRAKELSGSLKEAFARRDELQRQIKDIRSNLEVAVKQRDRLQTSVTDQEDKGEATASILKEKDDKIFRLSRELESWQDRVPPLVERFRERDEHARNLEVLLEAAQNQIASLQTDTASAQTRIEPADGENLPDGMDASNEPHSELPASEVVKDEITSHDETVVTVSDAVAEEFDAVERVADGYAVPEDGEAADNIEPPQSRAAAQNDEDATVPAMDSVDDLKEIKGVGPAIEKTLNDLGIRQFHQIAEMSEYDIDRVAQQLKGFRSRIYREDWIGQARNLQYQKNVNLT